MSLSVLLRELSGNEKGDQAMESQLSEERMNLERHLTKACDKNGSGEEARSYITNRLNQICSHFLPHFVHADTLAKKYQRSYTRGSAMIYMLAAFAVVVAAAQALFLPHVHYYIRYWNNQFRQLQALA